MSSETGAFTSARSSRDRKPGADRVEAPLGVAGDEHRRDHDESAAGNSLRREGAVELPPGQEVVQLGQVSVRAAGLLESNNMGAVNKTSKETQFRAMAPESGRIPSVGAT